MDGFATDMQIWAPNLFGKQWDVFNCRKRYLLVCGSRKAAKTWAVVHKICRHLWETPGANVGFFSKSKSLAKDSGVWQDLVQIAIPEWISSGIGFEFSTFDAEGIPGPKQDAQTRTTFFRIKNMHGGESSCHLFSIEHDHEVASKVKGKRFSMIFFSELSMFKSRSIFSVTIQQLRMPHLNPAKGREDTWHQWIADTNPDEDEGADSWFYKLFYEEREQKDHKKPSFQRNLHTIEMFAKDNPYVTQDELDELEASCEGDDALTDAYVHGIHGKGTKKREKLFTAWFRRNTHVLGGGPDEGDQIDVNRGSTMLYTGWDLGMVNHGFAILDSWIRREKDKNGEERDVVCWSVLDELVLLHAELGLSDFTHQALQLMRDIEDKEGRKFQWMHWSDDSALTVFRPTTASYDYMEVQAASAGLINLQGVHKPDGNVRSRIQLLRRLLNQNRIFVSSRCSQIIRMLENARCNEKEEFARGPYKHAFDALTYPLFMQNIEELLDRSRERPDAMETGRMISV